MCPDRARYKNNSSNVPECLEARHKNTSETIAGPLGVERINAKYVIMGTDWEDN